MDKRNPVIFNPEEREITKKYTNGEVTIVWKPSKCIHSMICWTGLPGVFDMRKRPWIKPEGSTTAKIIEQVKKCPSEALSFFMNTETLEGQEVATDNAVTVSEPKTRPVIVQTLENGPLIIYGDIVVKDSQGNETERKRVTSFCRCGLSKKSPYCDGAHNDRVM